MMRFLVVSMRLLDRLFAWVVVLAMISLVVIVSLQFIDRHFIDTGMAAPDQYARVALVWLTFVGFALAIRAAVNVRVDLIDAHLPVKLRSALEYVFDGMMIVLLVALLPGSWRLIEIGREQELLGTVFTSAVPAAAAFVSSLLMLFYLGMRLIARFIGMTLPEVEEL